MPTSAFAASATGRHRAEEARGDPPVDPPPGDDEEEWVEEEGEEEEIYVEDPITEVGRAAVEQELEEPEEPEFPDFTSPRTRRERSYPPIPLRLVPRETRERIELNQEIYRARREVGVTRRPLILRLPFKGIRKLELTKLVLG